MPPYRHLARTICTTDLTDSRTDARLVDHDATPSRLPLRFGCRDLAPSQRGKAPWAVSGRAVSGRAVTVNLRPSSKHLHSGGHGTKSERKRHHRDGLVQTALGIHKRARNHRGGGLHCWPQFCLLQMHQTPSQSRSASFHWQKSVSRGFAFTSLRASAL